MNADGSGVSRLTTDPGIDNQPSFSPDGSQIAFIGKHGASWYGDVFLMNADGSDQVHLIEQGGIEDVPTFSPDGQRIAFGRTEGGHKHIFTMNTSGGELTALTHGAFDDRQPSFSPDGQRIAFASRREGHTEIFTMRSDGSGVTKLTGKLSSAMPAYSPNGQQIAFVRGGAIFTMKASGGSESQLTSGHGSQAWPSWQPLVGPSQGSSRARATVASGSASQSSTGTVVRRNCRSLSRQRACSACAAGVSSRRLTRSRSRTPPP